MTGRKLGLWAGALVGLSLLAVSGCSSGQEAPNIILLTLDTTRSDHLGCYGRQGAVTPNLDRLAQEGVRFAEARTPVPITLPSHASILTGTYPPTHGVHLHTDIFKNQGLPTLAEILGRRGYQTAAFVAAKVLDADFGLNRGFDVYDDETGEFPDGSESHSQPAQAVVQKARRWFDSRKPGPYFVWLHFFDPHLAYDPPEPYRSRFAASPYDGEIAYMDAQIGVFLDGLFPGKKLQNTIVVAIGDHGESLGEHGLLGHTEFVYRETMQIPFLLAWPGKIKAGRTVGELVRSVDLMPTLLDLLKIEIPKTVEGLSLRPLIEGRTETPGRTSFLESHYLENLFGWSPLLGIERRPHKLIRAPRSELYDAAADRRESRNLYRAGDAVSKELDDLLDAFLAAEPGGAGVGGQDNAIDPQTRETLASLGYMSGSGGARPSESDLVNPMDHVKAISLYQRIQLGPQGNSTPEDLAVARQLAELEPEQPDVLKLWGDFLYKFGQYDEAETVYRKAAGLAPQDPAPLVQMAALARVRGDAAREGELLARAREVGPKDARVLFEMAAKASRAKQASIAVGLYQQAIALDPRYLEAMSELAAQHITDGQNGEAEQVLTRSFTLHQKNNADLARRHYLMGRALHRLSERRDEAIRHLEQAVRLAPSMPGPHYYLAVLLAELDRGQEAAGQARRYLELSPPNDPGAPRMKRIAGQP